MDPTVIADLALMLGIDEVVFQDNIVEVAAKVKRNGGSVDEAAEALDNYLKNLFAELANDSIDESSKCETEVEKPRKTEEEIPESKAAEVIQQKKSKRKTPVTEEPTLANAKEEGLPFEVVAEIGHPTIQDRYLTNPLPIAYYAIKYHGYKRCVPYFLELMADKAIANQTSIDICDYDPLELISWIPLKGFKPGTLAYNSSQFMWTADGTSLWERSYPRVGLNSGIIQRISPSKNPKKLCFGYTTK